MDYCPHQRPTFRAIIRDLNGFITSGKAPGSWMPRRGKSRASLDKVWGYRPPWKVALEVDCLRAWKLHSATSGNYPGEAPSNGHLHNLETLLQPSIQDVTWSRALPHPPPAHQWKVPELLPHHHPWGVCKVAFLPSSPFQIMSSWQTSHRPAAAPGEAEMTSRARTPPSWRTGTSNTSQC